MSMIHYQPWNQLAQLRRDMNRMMGDVAQEANSDWVPAIDIEESAEGFTIYADLPGVAAADIEIEAENGMLTLQGQRNAAADDAQQGYRRIERAHGRFRRRFTLPDSADTDQISARSDNGVLTITIPKRPEIQPRKIQVNG